MSGERLAWFQVASLLRMPVEELRNRITYAEFSDWLLFLDWDRSRETKWDHYLATLTAEVVKAPLGKADRKKIKRDHFMVRYTRASESQTARMEHSKAVWGSFLGAWKKQPKLDAETEGKIKAEKRRK